MSRRPKSMQPQPKPKQLPFSQWLKQPGLPVTRAEAFQVSRIVAERAIAIHEEQRRYSRWYWRLWAALERLLAAPKVTAEVTEASAPDAGTAPATPDLELTPREEAPAGELDNGIKFRDRRAQR